MAAVRATTAGTYSIAFFLGGVSQPAATLGLAVVPGPIYGPACSVTPAAPAAVGRGLVAGTAHSFVLTTADRFNNLITAGPLPGDLKLNLTLMQSATPDPAALPPPPAGASAASPSPPWGSLPGAVANVFWQPNGDGTAQVEATAWRAGSYSWAITVRGAPEDSPAGLQVAGAVDVVVVTAAAADASASYVTGAAASALAAPGLASELLVVLR